ncbi:uncharacterized protein TNCV_3064151 [Trichonephila clavipes]|nr:uncharacterized protein TNCV_3064151 [Trichonephila clavipes]
MTSLQWHQESYSELDSPGFEFETLTTLKYTEFKSTDHLIGTSAHPLQRLVVMDTGMGTGCGSQVVRVSDHGRYVMSSSPVPLKTRRVGQRCTLNLSRAETPSRWCGVVVRRGGASSGVVHVT